VNRDEWSDRCVAFPSKELKERLGIGDITSVLQQNRMRCVAKRI